MGGLGLGLGLGAAGAEALRGAALGLERRLGLLDAGDGLAGGGLGGLGALGRDPALAGQGSVAGEFGLGELGLGVGRGDPGRLDRKSVV